MPNQEQSGKENVNKYMVCNEPALFSGFVFVVLLQFNPLRGLQQSRPWIRLFHSVIIVSCKRSGVNNYILR